MTAGAVVDGTVSTRIVIGLTLVLLAGGSRLAEVGADVPIALGLARAAGRCADAGPLFLRTPCQSGNRRRMATVQCDRDDVRGCYMEALALQASGQSEAAVTALRRVVDSRYRLQFSATLLAFHLERQRAVADAAAVWRTCVGVDCEMLLIRAGTIDTCGAAAALTKQGPQASSCMGALLRQAGQLDEAMTWFRRALEGFQSRSTDFSAPFFEGAFSRADVLYRMGEIELARGRVPEAQRLTSECLAADPQHYWGRFQWALLLSRAGDTRGAIDELKHLIARYPAHGAAMLNLGLLYESIGNNKMAEHWFLEARKVLPDKSLADAQLQRVRGAGPASRLP